MLQEKLPKANAQCVVCGQPYYRCEKCIKLGSQGIFTWKLVTDTPQCFQIKSILDSYEAGLASEDDVRSAMESISVHSDIPMFVSPYKEIYEKVNSHKAELPTRNVNHKNRKRKK